MPQGRPSELRVEVTALKANHLPNIKTWLRMKRRFFVTITSQSAKLKSRSVGINGRTVVWNQKLGDLVVHSSSHLLLHLYAKRFLFPDILIGTHEMRLPDKPQDDISFRLNTGSYNQDRQSRRVTLHLAVNVANATSSPILSESTDSIATEIERPSTEEPIARSQLIREAPLERRIPPPPVNTGAFMPPPVGNIAMPVPVPSLPTRRPPNGAVRAVGAVGSFDFVGTVGAAGKNVPSTVNTGKFESTIDEIIKIVERFRILSIGRSGVGKSSLINCVFGINAARVENYLPGEADIQQELVSPENQFFVLHDSQGFEPGDLSNFETIRRFIDQRSKPDVPLRDRIHGLWLCTETPTAGGRLFETGDEKLLQYAHEKEVPLLIAFTQYDRLVRTKELELQEEYPSMDPARLRQLGVEEARKEFNKSVESLERTMKRLNIPVPPYATVSVRLGQQEDVSSLVEVTRDMVKDQVKGDAWVMWAIAQRASLPVKLNACIEKGINCYTRALTGSAPELGHLLLRDCLGRVHHDIITCWNLKGKVLESPKFRQLMLCLVQDFHVKPSPIPSRDVISEFVTRASENIVPPAALLGLTETFVEWLSTTFLENEPSVQQLLIAFTVDLISVLKELLDINLKQLALTTTWTELKEAYEIYGRSDSRQRVHRRICSNITRGRRVLTADGIRKEIRGSLASLSISVAS